MRKECAAAADQPALVVTYGNTTRKHRPLNQDVTLLGRAAGCDVALVSPEVAPVHCVIARGPGGWRLRDCTGRGGTRVNGRSVTDVLLYDEDVLQIGTFSFRVRLPASKMPAAANVQAVRHLQQSRRNLAQLALRLRQRVRVAEGAVLAQEVVDQQAERLRTLQRELEERRRRQEEAEAGLRAERLALDERARRLEETERLAAESQRQADVVPAAAQEELQRRAEELNVQSRNLTRRHLLVQEQAQELAREQEEFRRQRDQEGDDRQVAERLRLQIEVLEAEAADLKARFEAQQSELTTLRALEDAQAAVVELSGGAELMTLIASLRQQVRERDALLEEMQQRLARHSGPVSEDAADFEAELNRCRQEVEKDRREMNDQLAQLRERHEEMEEAAREAELQMARERAQIAREQAELNRLRSELSRAENRSPKERDLRERLAGIRQLKHDNGEPHGESPASTPPADRPLWRRFFGQPTEASTTT
jgi:pSer/pThr/pTyr-binding forkhead associated (FHA) protein